jgi:hypothetical protein
MTTAIDGLPAVGNDAAVSALMALERRAPDVTESVIVARRAAAFYQTGGDARVDAA